MDEAVDVGAAAEPARFLRTGDDAVDAVVAQLDGLGDDVPLERHVLVLDEVHDALQRRLGATQG